MKERKELTQGKAVALIILIYTILTIVFGTVYTLIIGLVARFLLNIIILSTISVIASIAIIYFSWKISIMITFKNRTSTGLDSKKMTRYFAIFLILVSVVSITYDIYSTKVKIEDQFSNSFLEDKDVVNAFSEEELQQRANENNENMRKSKQQSYLSIITMNTLSLIINLLVLSVISKKTIDKYDGVIEIEKNIKK